MKLLRVLRVLRVARFLILLAILVHRTAEGTCKELNFCSGHGRCVNEDFCDCYDGWGSASDLSLYKAPDCSRRVCPSGIAWADTPTMDGLAHNLAECSNKGKCNRVTGRCECFRNFVGDACQRSKCPNGCSGHGVCKSMRRLAKEYAVNTTTYENSVGDNGFVALIRVVRTPLSASLSSPFINFNHSDRMTLPGMLTQYSDVFAILVGLLDHMPTKSMSRNGLVPIVRKVF